MSKNKKTGTKVVLCLSCNRPFKSKGPAYRICKGCKKKQAEFARTAHKFRYSDKLTDGDWR